MGGWAALVVLIAGLGAAPLADPGFQRPPAKDGHRYPDCYCTDSTGARVELGVRACLTIGGRKMSARCGMSQNSPAWRDMTEGCPGV